MIKYKCIGIISPSIVLSEREKIDISRAVLHLESLGLKVKIAPSVYRGISQYPGSAKDKAQDIMAMYADEEVDILAAAYGGTGALSVLEHLDYKFIKKHPKPIIGFSDSTSIQLAVYAKTGIPFITGYLPEYEFRMAEGIDPLVQTGLENVLYGYKFNATSGRTVRDGICEGILLGECLSTISDMSGTPYYPNIADSILLIEDECESSYKISLMLTQLRYNPQFKNVKGIIIGRFNECSNHPTYGSMSEILSDFAAHVKVPMINNFNFGHFRQRFVLPCGVRYRLDASNCHLEQIEDL